MARGRSELLCVLLAVLWPVSSFAQMRTTQGEPSLAYWIEGPPDSGTTIVVVNGGPGVTHDYLLPEWNQLAANYRVVFYDQRGCGSSAVATQYTWRDHVADLRRIIKEVSPEAPVVLMGSSWGAMVAMYYALERPGELAAMVLSGLNAPNVWTRPGSDSVVGPLEDIDPARFGREWRKDQTELASRFHTCDDVLEETTRSLDDAPSLTTLYDIDVPVLFFPDNRFGREFFDAATAPERSGTFWTVVGGGHDPWYTHVETFFHTVGEFLAQLAGGDGT